MSGVEIGFIGIALMLAAVCIGVHIGVALIATSIICVTILANPTLAMRMATALRMIQYEIIYLVLSRCSSSWGYLFQYPILAEILLM